MIALTPQLLGSGEANSKKSLASSFAIFILAMSLNTAVINSNTSSPLLVDNCTSVQKRELNWGVLLSFGRQMWRSHSQSSVHLPTNQSPRYSKCLLVVDSPTVPDITRHYVRVNIFLETESYASGKGPKRA